jgi:hypothetical protein
MRWAVGALGALLCAAGAAVFVQGGRSPAGGGWTAYTGSYAPLGPGAYQSELTLMFDDGASVLWTTNHLLGAALVVLGLLVLAGLGGWLLGRRTAAGETPAA